MPRTPNRNSPAARTVIAMLLHIPRENDAKHQAASQLGWRPGDGLSDVALMKLYGKARRRQHSGQLSSAERMLCGPGPSWLLVECQVDLAFAIAEQVQRMVSTKAKGYFEFAIHKSRWPRVGIR
jgi:hypothetical protein